MCVEFSKEAYKVYGAFFNHQNLSICTICSVK